MLNYRQKTTAKRNGREMRQLVLSCGNRNEDEAWLGERAMGNGSRVRIGSDKWMEEMGGVEEGIEGN
jgi:hypothetical protein